MSCDNCFTSGRGLDEQLQIAIDNAKKDAIKEQKTYAVYKDGTEFKFIEYGIAVSEGYPIVQVVSQYP